MYRDTFYFSLCDKPSLLPHAPHGNYFSFTGSLPGFPRGNQDSPGGPGCGFTKSLSPPCLTRPPPVPLFPPAPHMESFPSSTVRVINGCGGQTGEVAFLWLFNSALCGGLLLTRSYVFVITFASRGAQNHLQRPGTHSREDSVEFWKNRAL